MSNVLTQLAAGSPTLGPAMAGAGVVNNLWESQLNKGGNQDMVNQLYGTGKQTDLIGSWLGNGKTQKQLMSDAYNAMQAQNKMNFESAESQKARDFEERMSNTSYQRQVQDMKEAGVNPALTMAGTSNGASTPNGAMANGAMATADASDNTASLQEAMDMVQKVAFAGQQFEANKANIANMQAEANYKNAEAERTNTLTTQEFENLKQTNTNMQEQVKTMKSQQDEISKRCEQMDKDIQYRDQVIENLKTENDKMSVQIDLLAQQSNSEVAQQGLLAQQTLEKVLSNRWYPKYMNSVIGLNDSMNEYNWAMTNKSFHDIDEVRSRVALNGTLVVKSWAEIGYLDSKTVHEKVQTLQDFRNYKWKPLETTAGWLLSFRGQNMSFASTIAKGIVSFAK